MTRPRGFGRALALALALMWSMAGVVGPVVPGATATASTDATALPPWTGSIDLYRRGVFTTQASWLYCTAADVQIARNIVRGEQDHGAASQTAYFDWMRTQNRYSIPVSDGIDVRGWTRGLVRWVDPRYAAVASTSFSNALRSAVRRLRQTDLPVALLVMHGDHGWLLTGFSATADPLLGPGYVVTAVRVVGPLYGLQSRGGYDMPPDTSLSPAQLARFLTPFHYARTPMVWEGRWMTIQPIPR